MKTLKDVLLEGRSECLLEHTVKQIVLDAYPEAKAVLVRGQKGVHVFQTAHTTDMTLLLGSGIDEDDAWTNATRRTLGLEK